MQKRTARKQNKVKTEKDRNGTKNNITNIEYYDDKNGIKKIYRGNNLMKVEDHHAK